MDQTEIDLRAAKVLVDAAAETLALQPGFGDAVVKLEQVSRQIERDLRQYDYEEQPTEEFDVAAEEPVFSNGE